MRPEEVVARVLEGALYQTWDPIYYVALRWWAEGGDVMRYWKEVEDMCAGRAAPPFQLGSASYKFCTYFRWHDHIMRCVGIECSLTKKLKLEVGRDYIYSVMDRHFEELGLGGVRSLLTLRRMLTAGSESNLIASPMGSTSPSFTSAPQGETDGARAIGLAGVV